MLLESKFTINMNASTYDSVVSDLYRAATGGIAWNQALEGIRVAFNARCAPVQTMDMNSGQLIAAHAGGPNMEQPVLDYLLEYNQCDPRAQIVLGRPMGEWVHCSDHHDEAFVARNRFYQDFLPSYNSRFVSGVVIPLGNNAASVFGIQLSSSRGPLSADEREFAKRIGEHLREALLAYERIRILASEALVGHTLLSAFASPMWLIDLDRFVFYSNSAAIGESQERCPLVRTENRFELVNSTKNLELTEKLLRLQWADHGATSVLTLQRTGSFTPVSVHLSLMVPGKVLGAFGEKPQILVTMFDPQQFSDIDPFAVSQMFGLTPAEGKVATLIAQGKSPADIAVQCGVKIPTVRSQLSQVFAKLGVARQADITRILCHGAGFLSSGKGSNTAF